MSPLFNNKTSTHMAENHIKFDQNIKRRFPSIHGNSALFNEKILKKMKNVLQIFFLKSKNLYSSNIFKITIIHLITILYTIVALPLYVYF